MKIAVTSIVAGVPAAVTGKVFRAVNPATGATLTPDFHAATDEQVDLACRAASEAAPEYAAAAPSVRADFLRDIAARLTAGAGALVAQAALETGLDPERLRGEVTRTAYQLTLFAEELVSGAIFDARIETGDASRRPSPKPDHRSMRIPVGPVAVFGASNFPFAYSVCGCDTAAALAAGCPVIAKAHPAQPGTAALTAAFVLESVAACGFPAGTFSLIFDAGIEAGRALVKHPAIRAVAFTGSRRGGRALMDLAAARPEPVPVYAEMGSSNPVFLSRAALEARGDAILAGLHASCVNGAGQFCTQPGLIFLHEDPVSTAFLDRLAAAFRATPGAAMLSPAIHKAYVSGTGVRAKTAGVRTLAEASAKDAGPFAAGPVLFATNAATYRSRHALGDEIFGPTSLAVLCPDEETMLGIARDLEGCIAAAVHAQPEDAAFAGRLFGVLAERAGRVVADGWTTGVEVSRAMVHGGPYPATSDGRTSSVGTTAAARFMRRVCYQTLPDALLPEVLRDANPFGILRLVDGKYSAGALSGGV